MSHAFDTVINCSGYTDVDGAESDEASANAVNGDAISLLSERCAAIGARLVHYSTDYVFDGTASTPYPVNAALAPVSAYGRSKALGESVLQRARCPWLLVRTSWLYAPWGKNFVRTIARLARVVNDQHGRPTDCRQLAANTLALLEREQQGVFHVTDGGNACTWFDFATEIVSHSGSSCEVLPCSTAEYPRPAPRPAYSVLDISGTEAVLGKLPDWKHNLASSLEDDSGGS